MSEKKEFRGSLDRYPGLSQEYPPYEVDAIERSIKKHIDNIANLEEAILKERDKQGELNVLKIQCKQRDAEIEILKKK